LSSTRQTCAGEQGAEDCGELLLLHLPGVDIVRGGETMFAAYCVLREETMANSLIAKMPFSPTRSSIVRISKPIPIAVF
jgi:hypothetical protein